MKIQTTQDTGRSVTVTHPELEPCKSIIKLADLYVIANLMKFAAVDADFDVQVNLAHAHDYMERAIKKLEGTASHDA